jgi:hypothetical protein
MAALKRNKLEHVLRHLFFHLRWRKVAVLGSNVGIVCEMEAGAEHSSACFKQRVMIEFLTAEGVTADETWVHFYEPETKCQSTEYYQKSLHHAISTFFRRCRKTFMDIPRLI